MITIDCVCVCVCVYIYVCQYCVRACSRACTRDCNREPQTDLFCHTFLQLFILFAFRLIRHAAILSSYRRQGTFRCAGAIYRTQWLTLYKSITNPIDVCTTGPIRPINGVDDVALIVWCEALLFLSFSFILASSHFFVLFSCLSQLLLESVSFFLLNGRDIARSRVNGWIILC